MDENSNKTASNSYVTGLEFRRIYEIFGFTGADIAKNMEKATNYVTERSRTSKRVEVRVIQAFKNLLAERNFPKDAFENELEQIRGEKDV